MASSAPWVVVAHGTGAVARGLLLQGKMSLFLATKNLCLHDCSTSWKQKTKNKKQRNDISAAAILHPLLFFTMLHHCPGHHGHFRDHPSFSPTHPLIVMLLGYGTANAQVALPAFFNPNVKLVTLSEFYSALQTWVTLFRL